MFQELNGSKIHRLENVITLVGSLHDAFDRLEIWLTATVHIFSLLITGSNIDCRKNVTSINLKQPTLCFFLGAQNS